jgi:drug/metabolite transporter (DMT)-like permease
VGTRYYELVTPFFAAIFAGLALGEWPAVSAVPAALLTIVGIILVVRSEPKAAAAEA